MNLGTGQRAARRITKVVIYNEETREGHRNLGKTEKVELRGEAFAHLLRRSMSFPEFFSYINSFADWEGVKES
jgi:hypothetical protein